MRRGLLIVAGVAASTLALPSSAMAGGGCHREAQTYGSGAVVELGDMCMNPSVLRAAPGATVTFVNRDAVLHNVWGESWGAGDLAPGASRPARLRERGHLRLRLLAAPEHGRHRRRGGRPRRRANRQRRERHARRRDLRRDRHQPVAPRARSWAGGRRGRHARLPPPHDEFPRCTSSYLGATRARPVLRRCAHAPAARGATAGLVDQAARRG